VIVSSGYNIGGPEVEEVLLLHPDVAECAVVAAPHPDRGSIVAAYVVLRPGVSPDQRKVEALQNFAKNRAAPYKYRRLVEFTPERPRNPSGSITNNSSASTPFPSGGSRSSGSPGSA